MMVPKLNTDGLPTQYQIINVMSGYGHFGTVCISFLILRLGRGIYVTRLSKLIRGPLLFLLQCHQNNATDIPHVRIS